MRTSGKSPTLRGPWSRAAVEEFLASARIPLRLGCLTPSGGPAVLSLWYQYADAAFWCATRPQARLVGWLQSDPRCGFEVAADAPPYRGVRGQGVVELLPAEGARVLTALVDRYLGRRDSSLARWLLRGAEREIALRIVPTWMTTWDYSDRMADR